MTVAFGKDASQISERLSSRAAATTRVSGEIFGGAIAIADALAILVSAVVIYFVYLELLARDGLHDPLRYMATVLLAGTFTLHRVAVARMYRLENLYDAKRQIKTVLVAWSAAMVGLVILGFLLKISEDFSRVWLVTWYFVAAGTFGVSRIGIARLLYRWGRERRVFRRVVVVGTGPLGKRFIDATLLDPSLCVVGAFDDRVRRSPEMLHGVPVLGGTERLQEFLRQARADMVLIALPLSAASRISEIASKLRGFAVDVRLLSDAIGFQLGRRAVSYPAGIPAFSILDRPISGWAFITKRTLDVTLAATALAILSPVLLAIGFLIKCETPGPVLFRQPRLGFNNNVFEIFKFRTMRAEVTDANAERLVTRGDSRVTSLGRILRRFSLDELPQLWNVIKGDMSLVGPRPHALRAKAGDKLYHEVVAEYAARHRVKPGITGWAQVSGWRGETDTIEKIQRRVEHDLYYIEHWSIAFDIWILVLTVVKAFGQRNAF